MGRKKAARVSRTPGRTQLINLFEIDEELRFVDLPGYGFAKVPAQVRKNWKAMIEGYLFQRSVLQMVVVLVDARHPAQKLDIEMLGALQLAEVPALVVATKVDTLSRNKMQKNLAQLKKGLGISTIIPFSAPTKEGVNVVWSYFDRKR